MSYYTEYSLKVQVSEEREELEIIDLLRKENKSAAYALSETGESYQESKWYFHEEDLLAFSKKHPYALFILSGVGEEGDMWSMYFKDGECQKVETQIAVTPYQ